MSPTARVLVIEDQHDIAANIWDFLERRGYEVDHAGDGASGLQQAMRGSFDAIVLDLGLPRLDGLALCRRLREAGRGTPVLMLTARDTLDDKLRGFAQGADDYMVKPFELKELDARIRALLRHARTRNDAPLAVGELQFDAAAMTATRAGRSIPLTRTQAAILGLLLQRSPGVVTQQALIEQVWPQREGDVRALHTHIYELRALIDKPFARGLIQTVHGIGYRLLDDDA